MPFGERRQGAPAKSIATHLYTQGVNRPQAGLEPLSLLGLTEKQLVDAARKKQPKTGAVPTHTTHYNTRRSAQKQPRAPTAYTSL